MRIINLFNKLLNIFLKKRWGKKFCLLLGEIYFLKSYGPYQKNGETHWRNYHRELKNKKGISLVELWGMHLFGEDPLLLSMVRREGKTMINGGESIIVPLEYG